MTFDNLVMVQEGPVAVVTLNRPQRRNALSLDSMQELTACLDDIGRCREPPRGRSAKTNCAPDRAVLSQAGIEAGI